MNEWINIICVIYIIFYWVCLKLSSPFSLHLTNIKSLVSVSHMHAHLLPSGSIRVVFSRIVLLFSNSNNVCMLGWQHWGESFFLICWRSWKGWYLQKVCRLIVVFHLIILCFFSFVLFCFCSKSHIENAESINICTFSSSPSLILLHLIRAGLHVSHPDFD